MSGGMEGVFGDPRAERDGESQRLVHRLSINTSFRRRYSDGNRRESAVETKKADTNNRLFFSRRLCVMPDVWLGMVEFRDCQLDGGEVG